ncbi:MAG TPA: anti-sigma factor [Ramlibacter sp.]|uniref:anti-sigma factor n=1 Tax=Ramlibacter sp. TaxID=1917967 RepID=UPI002BD929EC|nr:anti-sigma factor [Ramlibacter sp.]HVZ44956.1 anti-sigma factor [Ramlibacter sp.]
MQTRTTDTRSSSRAIAESEIHAMVDGRLSPAAAAALRERLAHDPEAAATARAWQQQRAELRDLHASVVEQPVPASLVAAADRLARTHERVTAWWRYGGLAASLVLVFGLGWTAGDEWRDWRGPGAYTRLEPAARHFAQQASVAFAVYQPEVRHPVEVTAAQQEHLVQWLSKRLGRPLKVPVLTDQGYELVGGRLLPGEDGARAQFMYQNATGQRVTLYLGAIKAGGGNRETAFRFLSEGPVNNFYWVDGGFGCALSGQLARGALMELAEAAYRQIDPPAAGLKR